MCGSKGTSTTSSTFTPPANVQANYDYLANQAKSVAATPFQQYQGEMVAGLTPTQEAGIQNVNASAGLAQPYYGAGAGYVQQAATPFGQQQLNQYMSPYINDVVSQTMANLGETNAQQQQQLLGNAISQGAFGGDRAGIAQAELARQQNLATGQTLANVLQGGYGQALGQFNADQTRALQAGSTLGQLGAGAQAAGLQGAQAQLGAGAQQQAVQQAQDVANQQQFQAAQAYPFQTTQFLGNMLLGIGGQSGGTALTSTPGPNIGSQILGGLTTLASIPWGSDERLKENMEPVGETYDGQKIYKFNYKNDGHTMLGLSAQEVEKHHPDAVHKDGEGMRMVDYEKAVNHAAQRGHFAHGGIPDWMGGAVGADGLGRAHYALEGSVPYSEQPSGGSTKPLTLADVMRVSQAILGEKPGGKTNIPQAPKPQEDGGLMDVAKQLANATPEQRANMRANAGKLGLGTANVQDVLGTPGQRVGDVGGLYSAPIGPLQQFASGGVVGRHKYATDGSVQAPAQGAQTTDQPQSLFERVSGQPLSDNARMGLLAAGLGMLSSKSPFFGVGVGEGATAGLGTYYNALANQRAYENQLAQKALEERKVQVEEKGLGYRGIEANIALQNADQTLLANLMQRAQAYLTVPGGKVPPDLQSQIDAINTRMFNRSGGVGAASTSTPISGGLVSPPTNAVLRQAPAPAATVPAVSPDQSAVSGAPATVKAEPAPAAPAVSTTATTKEQPQPSSTTAPQPQPDQQKPKSKWGLPDEMDPDVLEADARNDAALGYGTIAAQKQAKADANRKMLTEQGGLYVNGQFQSVPGWIENKANQAATAEGYKSMITNDQAEAKNYTARVNVENRISSMLDILHDFQTGAFATQRNELVRKMEDLGFKVPKSAQIDPTAYLEFMKDSYAQLFESAKALGGRILVSELSGLQKSGASVGNPPEANAYILTRALGALKYQDQLTQEYNQWRQSDQGKIATSTLGFDLTHADENKMRAFQKEVARHVTYEGQKIPETADQLVHGQRYRYNGQDLYWNKNLKDPSGNLGSFDKVDPLAGGANG